MEGSDLMYREHSGPQAYALAQCIRWGVLGVIRSAPTQQALWMAEDRLCRAEMSLRDYYAVRCDRKPWDYYPGAMDPNNDNSPDRVVLNAIQWARNAIKDSMENAPAWPQMQCSADTYRALESAHADRPENLNGCIERLSAISHGRAFVLRRDGDSFGFSAGGMLGGLIWHATPGQWSLHT